MIRSSQSRQGHPNTQYLEGDEDPKPQQRLIDDMEAMIGDDRQLVCEWWMEWKFQRKTLECLHR